ncbi:MAG: FKBP-type peptidyl-prolyl cis-trans isomerase [Verrucomicrobia bacterium]|nr:FKBP-type peptidyl-prolyl cis-trans isomerase [Verrucomicrobiota bacterium]
MKSRLSLVLPLSLAVVLAAPAQQTPPPAAGGAPAASNPYSGKSQKEKASYAIGVNIGRNLKQQPGLEVDMPSIIVGLQDGTSGAGLKLSDKEMEEALQAMSAEISKKAAAKAKEAGEANKKEGDAFLAANKSKEGVQVRPSGLQYKVLKEGNGATPKATDTVKVHYRGTLINGKEFDSSYKRNEPATFPVNRVIPGWTEALQLMKVGSKYQLWIPSELAYKENGAGQDIGPNAMLTFEVELLGIEAEKK